MEIPDHAPAAVDPLMPVLIGDMQDRGATLHNAMTIAIAASLILRVVLIWSGPQTRGCNFSET